MTRSGARNAWTVWLVAVAAGLAGCPAGAGPTPPAGSPSPAAGASLTPSGQPATPGQGGASAAPAATASGTGTLVVDGVTVASSAKVLVSRYGTGGFDLALGGVQGISNFTFYVDVNLDNKKTGGGTYDAGAATTVTGTLRAPASALQENWIGVWTPAAPAGITFELKVDGTGITVKWAGAVAQKSMGGAKQVEFTANALPIPAK